jgi:uncharacterized protein (TIGR02996 family)
MSDEGALLRAICAEPADDTARLVYADWLDEHEQPERAEFIRVQVDLARVTPPVEVRAYRFERLPPATADDRGGAWKLARPDPPRARVWVEGCPLLRRGDVIDVPDMPDSGGRGLLVTDVQVVPVSAGRPIRFELTVDLWPDHFPHRAQWLALRAHARTLLRATGPDSHPDRFRIDWAGGVVMVGADSWQWSRGFVGHVWGHGHWWAGFGDAIRRAHPVTTVALSALPNALVADGAVQIVNDPAGVRVAWVDIVNELTPEERNVTWWPALLRLRWPGVTFEVSL